MTHNLIVQLPLSSKWGTPEELNLRHQLETEFEAELGDLGSVSGGDIGSGNMNVFVVDVHDFDGAFAKLKAVLLRRAVLDIAVVQRSSFIDPDDDPVEEVVVWPENFTGTFRLF